MGGSYTSVTDLRSVSTSSSASLDDLHFFKGEEDCCVVTVVTEDEAAAFHCAVCEGSVTVATEFGFCDWRATLKGPWRTEEWDICEEDVVTTDCVSSQHHDRSLQRERDFLTFCFE